MREDLLLRQPWAENKRSFEPFSVREFEELVAITIIPVSENQ